VLNYFCHRIRRGAEKPNEGKLMLDATCSPADIAYPTDLVLLNQAREKLEQVIDVLYSSAGETTYYQQKARKPYLSVAKQRRMNSRTLRAAIGKQLKLVARNLRMIEKLHVT
jgi:IS5 family transposase